MRAERDRQSVEEGNPRTGLAVRVVPRRLAVVIRGAAVGQARYVAIPSVAVNWKVRVLRRRQADEARGRRDENGGLSRHSVIVVLVVKKTQSAP